MLLATGLSRSSRPADPGRADGGGLRSPSWCGRVPGRGLAGDRAGRAQDRGVDDLPVLDAAVLTIAILILARAQPGAAAHAGTAGRRGGLHRRRGRLLRLPGGDEQAGEQRLGGPRLAGRFAAADGRQQSPVVIHTGKFLCRNRFGGLGVAAVRTLVAAAFSVGLLESPEDVRTVPIMAPSVVLVVAFLIRQLLLVTGESPAARCGGRERRCAIH